MVSPSLPTCVFARVCVCLFFFCCAGKRSSILNNIALWPILWYCYGKSHLRQKKDPNNTRKTSLVDRCPTTRVNIEGNQKSWTYRYNLLMIIDPRTIYPYEDSYKPAYDSYWINILSSSNIIRTWRFTFEYVVDVYHMFGTWNSLYMNFIPHKIETLFNISFSYSVTYPRGRI